MNYCNRLKIEYCDYSRFGTLAWHHKILIYLHISICTVCLKSKVKGQHDNGCNGRIRKDKRVRLYENLALPRVEPHHSTCRYYIVEADWCFLRKLETFIIHNDWFIHSTTYLRYRLMPRPFARPTWWLSTRQSTRPRLFESHRTKDWILWWNRKRMIQGNPEEDI